MNDYRKKQITKALLMLAAIGFGIGSLVYTNSLVQELSVEERKKVALWAEALRQLEQADMDADLSFIAQILQDNKTVPAILVDQDGNILYTANLDTAKAARPEYLAERLEEMAQTYEPIAIPLWEDKVNYAYYDDSTLLERLQYYPWAQLLVITVFVGVSYLAFSASRQSEQNRVWVGMSKETAHQLGTPISSLMAWVEYAKAAEPVPPMIAEVEEDVKRLETITERFSKIGSSPVLKPHDLTRVMLDSLSYLERRVSRRVKFERVFSHTQVVSVPMNVALFEWVVENLAKNAIDAMEGSGTLTVVIIDDQGWVHLDLSDTGKGIAKSQHKTIFKPGYTTKARGWGLGLSLAKRIVEGYHGGKIFVKRSEPGVGTTFRISLRKA